MNKGQKQITEFIKVFTKELKLSSKSLLKISSFDSFDESDLEFDKVFTQKDDLSKVKENFDFVFAELPFGMNRENSKIISSQKVNRNWNLIIDSGKLINNKGILLAVAEPGVYSTQMGREFLKSLETVGIFLNLILSAPDKIYYPQTAFSPIILGFSKLEINKLFIAEIENENENLIVSNFKNKTSESIENGLWLNKDSFSNFQKIKIETQIRALKTQYKDYKQYKLSEISKSINLTRNEFEDKENSIYIPKIGTSQVVSKIQHTKIKHQNLFQIELDSNLVLAEYLELFYKSELGQLILNSLTTGSFIPSINKSSIQDSLVAVPAINEQKILIQTFLKLIELQRTIDDLKLELSLNPKNANVILDKFESISSPLKKLSVEDEILSLIRKGENKKIEFKQTFSKNIHTQNKDKEIEKSSLKNIVGFLNSQGGTLLIGVSDNGEVTGIEDDFYKSNDKYLLNFKNALNSKIGSEFYPLIDFDLYNVLEKLVLKVDCKPSQKPCFFDGNEFYVRTNPATDKLEGRQLIEYVNRRFK